MPVGSTARAKPKPINTFDQEISEAGGEQSGSERADHALASQRHKAGLRPAVGARESGVLLAGAPNTV